MVLLLRKLIGFWCIFIFVFVAADKNRGNSNTKVREGGEATRYFCIVGTVFVGCCCCCSFCPSSGWPPSRRHRESSRLLLVVSSFGLSYTFSKTNFSLILEVGRNLFVHSLHLQALVNANIAF